MVFEISKNSIFLIFRFKIIDNPIFIEGLLNLLKEVLINPPGNNVKYFSFYLSPLVTPMTADKHVCGDRPDNQHHQHLNFINRRKSPSTENHNTTSNSISPITVHQHQWKITDNRPSANT